LSTLMQWNSHPAIPPPQTSKKPLDIPSKNILDSVSKMSLDITELATLRHLVPHWSHAGGATAHLADLNQQI
ncbi:hypothetical protein ACN4BK_08470, partial [Corynebacterium macclintockiae]|uniref:hypothetical protein n=1 Tax=Corynebacterium macclintockiae TaxID=2913501 RepID=UPI003EC02B1C